MNVLVEEFRFLNEPLELCHTVKETAGNFSSHFTMHIMNREVNRISDELQPLSTIIHCVKLSNVDIGEADLLYRRCRWSLLGRRLHVWLNSLSVEVVRSHTHAILVHVRGATGSLLLIWWGSLITTGMASTVAAAAIVLSSTTLLVIVVISSLVLIVSLLNLLRPSVCRCTKASHAAHLLFHSLGLVSEIFRMSDPVHHLVLFLVVTFIFEFLLRNPEVNRYRSVSERRHLVQIFDRKLCMVDILI